MGLVEVKPNRGAVVKALDAKEIGDVYVMRSVLEGLATRLATEHCTDRAIRDLTKLNDDMRAAAQMGDAISFVEYNFAFHRLLYSFANNPILEATIRNLVERIPMSAKARWRSIEKALGAVAAHNEILAAVRERDGSTAEAAMRRHIKWAPHASEEPQ